MGRRTKLNPEIQAEIAGMIEDGVPVETATGVCGLHPDTFYKWMKRGQEESSGVYTDFFEAITRARDNCRASMAAKWKKLALQGVTKRTVVYREEIITDPTTGQSEIVKVLDRETIEEVGDGDWRAIAEYLARSDPERWGKKSTTEHVGARGGPVQIDSSPIPLDKLSPGLKRQILEELETGNVVEVEARLIEAGETKKTAPLPVPDWWLKLEDERSNTSSSV